MKILRKIADDLNSNEQLIMERNMRDVAAAERKKIDPTLMQRLRLKPAKIRTLVQGIRAIADQEEPLRKVRLNQTGGPPCVLLYQPCRNLVKSVGKRRNIYTGMVLTLSLSLLLPGPVAPISWRL